MASIKSTYKRKNSLRLTGFDYSSEGNPTFAWQRSFYDRVVRSQKELERIEDYIYNNPLKFSLTNNSTLFNGVDL